MRFILCIAALILVILPASGQSGVQPQTDHLTNADVVSMLKAGLSAELITAKIKASKSTFDTSPAALAELKRAGIPESVLMAMIEAGAPPPAAQPAPTPNQNIEAGRAALRALRRLASATDVGISYQDYSPLVGSVKAEVDDSLAKMDDGPLKAKLKSSLNEYEYAAHVWQATWRGDFVDGQLKDVAVKQYGVPKKGWLKVVWRADFLAAIWRQARNNFEVAEQGLRQASSSASTVSPGHIEDALVGAWRLTITAPDGNSAQLDLTIAADGSGYTGTLRTPMGNLATRQITKTGNTFSISASEVEKKKTNSIIIEGTVEGNSMKGTLTFSDGNKSATGQFTGLRIS